MTMPREAPDASRPNIVLITADNQPATLLGCYGNADVRTPHIDRMAAEGMRFNWAFSTNGMCSPGRASIFTGLMPSTHGVHNWLDDAFLDLWPSDWCAIREYPTLATTLQAAGFQTALIGKYHLGHPTTPMPGFDHWLAFATGHTVDFYDNEVIEEGQRRQVRGRHIVDYFTDKAVEHLSNLDADYPFFLNINYDAPYLLPPANLGADHRNRFYPHFKGKSFDSFPRTAIGEGLLRRIDGPDDEADFYRHHLYGYLRMHNDPATMANVCAQVAIVDDGVGRILDALRSSGHAENTLVVFTADQSNLYGQHGLWGHTMDTDPSHLYDAGLHIPLILWHPGSIAGGRMADDLVSQVDFAPTLLDYVDLGGVTFESSPGRSFEPMLRGLEADEWEDVVFFEQEESRGVRTSRYSYWKRLEGVGAPVLFDLGDDPEQEHDVSGDPRYVDVVGQLDDRLVAFFDRYADPRYDLWRGGRAKGSVRKVAMYKERYGEDWEPVTDASPAVEPLDSAGRSWR
jgi:arylsulfatase A-like enzyme